MQGTRDLDIIKEIWIETGPESMLHVILTKHMLIFADEEKVEKFELKKIVDIEILNRKNKYRQFHIIFLFSLICCLIMYLLFLSNMTTIEHIIFLIGFTFLIYLYQLVRKKMQFEYVVVHYSDKKHFYQIIININVYTFFEFIIDYSNKYVT